ncbi:AraC family transcriptional regulator [Mangrovitalea sediminis]|uniref:AraC family transcriptional regulator n=1 Tax=Mangrovitalea sediminis TaxID=1982043 RepID=UPI0013040819|nr:helix-turn-helix transcriptional regulator [Mangrovitalea sediminis]
MDQPLINHAVCLKAPLALVGEALRKQVPGIRIQGNPTSPGGDHQAFMGVVALPDIQATYINYGQAVQVQSRHYDHYSMLWIEKGRAVVCQEAFDRITYDKLHFLQPDSPLEIFYAEDTPHLAIRLTRKSGRQEILDRIFRDTKPQSSPVLRDGIIRACRQFLEHQRHVISHKESLNGLQQLREQLYNLFQSSLEGRPITLPEISPLDPRIRKVANFLRQEPRWEYNANLLCEMAGMSLRGLYYAFERALGSTPYRYHRAQKLIRVRAALLADHNQRHPIAWHATNEGFYHLSRFAAQYRSLFGELPSETLQGMRQLQYPLSLSALGNGLTQNEEE